MLDYPVLQQQDATRHSQIGLKFEATFSSRERWLLLRFLLWESKQVGDGHQSAGGRQFVAETTRVWVKQEVARRLSGTLFARAAVLLSLDHFLAISFSLPLLFVC